MITIVDRHDPHHVQMIREDHCLDQRKRVPRPHLFATGTQQINTLIRGEDRLPASGNDGEKVWLSRIGIATKAHPAAP